MRVLRQAARAHVFHPGDGRWWDDKAGRWRDGAGAAVVHPARPYRLRWTLVRLAACHVDHDPENLRAWCQRCHLTHDAPEHRRRRDVTVLARRACGDLFTGPYPP